MFQSYASFSIVSKMTKTCIRWAEEIDNQKALIAAYLTQVEGGVAGRGW